MDQFKREECIRVVDKIVFFIQMIVWVPWVHQMEE